MRIRAIICQAMALAFSGTAIIQAQPRMSDIDRIRIAEAFRLARQIGDFLWGDWHSAPFALLLVSPETEFLIRHPQPSEEFEILGYDSLLESMVFHRPRIYQPGLLATFPAVGGLPTIVIGQAENTSVRRSTRWVLTVLHEHFHQLQYSRPGYYQKVQDLNLSRGDESGMWILNFSFPYDTLRIGQLFDQLACKLAETLLSQESDFPGKWKEYRSLRDSLSVYLSEDDYRYFSFQVWQEGISRYTEFKTAEIAARSYLPTERFRSLRDYTPFSEETSYFYSLILDPLRNISLQETRRVAFYAFGAAEGLLLDRISPGWRKGYFDGPLSIDPYLPVRE